MEQLSLRTSTIEPVLWSLGATATGPGHPRPLLPTREQPPLTSTRETPTQQGRSSTAKNKQKRKNRIRARVYLSLHMCVHMEWIICVDIYPYMFLSR